MQFKHYAEKAVSYEKKMQIEENRMKVEMTLDSLRSYLQCANIFNVEADSLYNQIASVGDLSNRSNYFIDLRHGPQTEAQKKMIYNIEHISDYAQDGVKMNFIVDMEKKKYLSAAKDEEIPVRVYFRPGANMPGRREVSGLESAGRIRPLRQACAQNQIVESGCGPERGRGCPD